MVSNYFTIALNKDCADTEPTTTTSKNMNTGIRLSKQVGALVCLTILSATLHSNAYAKCQPFLVESNNGDGGFRFMHDVKNFRVVPSGTRYEAVICDRKTFRVELAKRNPEARVRFSIDGKPYEFAEGGEGDKNVNNWYRKYFDVSY